MTWTFLPRTPLPRLGVHAEVPRGTGEHSRAGPPLMTGRPALTTHDWGWGKVSGSVPGAGISTLCPEGVLVAGPAWPEQQPIKGASRHLFWVTPSHTVLCWVHVRRVVEEGEGFGREEERAGLGRWC